MSESRFTRREILAGLATLSTAALSGCLEVMPGDRLWRWLMTGEALNQWLLGGEVLPVHIKTYPPSAISREFRINSLNLSDAYRVHALQGWKDWTLTIDGLVKRPLELTLPDVRRLPVVSQITRLDCVEGWSAIAQWTGVRLSELLDRCGVLPEARYAVCFAADEDDGGVPFYGSLDLRAARHPNTILAYDFNGQPLPVDRGAPLRLVLPSQLGYKSTKFIHRITLMSEFGHFRGGKGGYWEDAGYEWFAGI